MESLNRRRILGAAAAGTAAFALSPVSNIWAQSTGNERTIESTLTGSVIELVSDDWEFSLGFGGQDKGDDYLRELYIMNNETSILEVEFVQSQLAPEEYVSLAMNRMSPDTDDMEIAGSGVTDGGLWFAATLASSSEQTSIYCEYQPGAYETADLMVTLRSQPEAFAQNVPSVQEGILIGDLAPFIMVESSEVLSLEFPVIAVAAATETSGRSTRSSRTRRSSSGNEQSTTRSSRRQQGSSSQSTSTSTASSNDFVDAVRSHRQQFQTSIGEFAEAVEIFADEAATDAQLEDAFDTIDALAESWLAYPQQAGQLNAPPELAELGNLYLEWADAIGALGQAWFDFVNSVGTVDDLFDQIDVVDQLNSELLTALDSV